MCKTGEGKGKPDDRSVRIGFSHKPIKTHFWCVVFNLDLNAYDNNGNTLTKVTSAGTTTYGWDYENRLTSVTLPGTGGTLAFKYDGLGRRVQKAFSLGSTTTTTNYLYDGYNAVADVDQNGIVLARYEHGPNVDQPLAQLRSGTTSYYEADGLGSITSLSTSTGTLANTYTYDSFGNLTASTGSVANRFQYTAREFDSETGLYFYRARYYSPSTGKFLSEDPIRFDAGLNFYPYVGNSTVNFTDPLGLCTTHKPCDEWLNAILDLEAEIWERFDEYNNPKWWLPLTGKNSRAGHLQQIENKQVELQQEIDDYNDSDCPSPIPVFVYDVATWQVPALTPSPWHLPPPPNLKLNQNTTTTAVGITTLGILGIALLILVF